MVIVIRWLYCFGRILVLHRPDLGRHGLGTGYKPSGTLFRVSVYPVTSFFASSSSFLASPMLRASLGSCPGPQMRITARTPITARTSHPTITILFSHLRVSFLVED